MQSDWMYELGRYLEKVRRLERDMESVQEDVQEIKTLIQRGMLLGVLWGGAVLLMLSNEKAAEIVLALLSRGG